jgi:hypothetical protein
MKKILVSVFILMFTYVSVAVFADTYKYNVFTQNFDLTGTGGSSFAGYTNTDTFLSINNTTNVINLTTGALVTTHGTNTMDGAFDMSGASTTSPMRIAAADPATCTSTVREMYFNTVSNVVKYCSAANTWTTYGATVTGNGCVGNVGGTLTGRTLSALTTALTVANGDCSANPTVDLSYLGSATHPPFFSNSAASGTIGATATGAANTIYIVKQVIPFRVNITTIRFWLQTASAAGQTAAAGLYDSSLNLVTQTGALATDTGAIAAKSATVSVTIQPGVYYIAFAASTITTVTFGTLPYGTANTIFNNTVTPSDRPMWGTATGVYSGVTGLPAAITSPVGSVGALNIPAVVFVGG